LGNDRTLPCGELCRIMREYTNIRDARVAGELKLADPLLPTSSVRPNIFIFVIDSLRPDYLRAYNPHVEFTPHLDQFAQDSTVIRNVYTQYAGTSLSEPAIWAGALLLHTHNMQSFENLNSLARLAKTDGYLTVVSTDEVLREMLKPSSDMVVLDADITLWNKLEVCSTIRQTIKLLDQRSDQTRPVLFYSQPKNVHQFANNGNPTLATANWIAPSGFSGRIALEVHQVDDCVGAFFSYLKGRGLYDSSIIILTSDHGDATGEFGRLSHSTSIFPEIMRVPLIVHLPKKMRDRLVYDDSRVSTLTDITPSLYYLLGHRPVVHNPVAGRPLFMETPQELTGYRRDELFLASDVRAAYGVLADNGRYLYATYDSPAQSYLFDLSVDPNGEHNIVTEQTKRKYDERIIENLRTIADFYGYKPKIGSWFSGGSSP
jgi:arylsulfatase A-like enzyme